MWGFSLLALVVLLAAPVRAEAPPPPRPAAEGEVCGDAALAGVSVPAIVAEGGCGIAAPVRLSSAAGVALDPAATLGCPAARALAAWLAEAVAPAFAAKGARVEAVAVADAFSCRNRNRAKAGKLSEHALGGAIDIGGFRLQDGTSVALREGWGSAEWGATLRRVHDAGCGTFGTVLGPEANALHADHLHFDMEERRSGPWCK